MASTNYTSLKKLSEALRKFIANAKKGNKYVPGGMLGVEQSTKAIEQLSLYVDAYLEANYTDINNTNARVTVLEGKIGTTFEEDIYLKKSDHNKRFIYIGELSSVKIYLPDSNTLAEGSTWNAELTNASINGNDIVLEALTGDTVDGAQYIDFNYGEVLIASYNNGTTFITKLGSGGGGIAVIYNPFIFQDSGFVYDTWTVNDADDVSWVFKKYDETDVSIITFATITNNPTVTTQTDAITNYSTLTYA